MKTAKVFGWLRSPALHMAALGGLLFGLVQLDGAPWAAKPRVEVPAHRLDQMAREFVADTGRPPTGAEWADMIELQVDEEILFQYALALGMHENTSARTRLAQIADFVEANPHHAATEAEKAGAAMELGLHEGDVVVRRILADSARRLIRGVVLLQEPSAEAVERFYAEHLGEYARPARLRLSQVAVNGFKWPDSEARARELLERIRAGGLGLDAALALADETPAPVHLPLQTLQGIESQLGNAFAAAAADLAPGRWSEPIPSDYGHHLVWVHEVEPAGTLPLDAVRAEVEQAVLQRLADEWLRLRLDQLRSEYEVVVPGRTS